MKTGKSVQFKTIDDIIQAYESRDVSKFAIFQDKQFLFKYEGSDISEGRAELETMCRALRQSAAIYTLAVYEDLPDGSKIKSDTPYDGSFNFRFQDNTDGYNAGSGLLREVVESQRVMNERINKIIEDRDTEVEVEDSPDDMLNKISGILSNPIVTQYMPMLLNAIGIKPPQVGALAGLPGESDIELSESVYMAVCKMIQVDPGAESALIKLGNVAASDPQKFKTILQYTTML